MLTCSRAPSHSFRGGRRVAHVSRPACRLGFVPTGRIRPATPPTRPRHQRLIPKATDPKQSSRKTPLVDIDDTYEERHAFASYAHWLVPGALMVGRYPFVEPSRCRTRTEGEQQIRSILEAGITVFYSLQDELPEQADMPPVGVNGFMPYKAVADRLMAEAMPAGPAPAGRQVGSASVETDEAPAHEANIIQLQYIRSPILDKDIPDSLEVVDELVEELQAAIGSGKKVYLHCWGGRGRAGVIGACYLVRVHGLGANEALERVQLSFDTRRDRFPQSPQTNFQRQFVKEFAAAQQWAEEAQADGRLAICDSDADHDTIC